MNRIPADSNFSHFQRLSVASEKKSTMQQNNVSAVHGITKRPLFSFLFYSPRFISSSASLFRCSLSPLFWPFAFPLFSCILVPLPKSSCRALGERFTHKHSFPAYTEVQRCRYVLNFTGSGTDLDIEGNGEGYLTSQPTMGSGERRKLPRRGTGQSPCQNRI